MKKIRLSGGNFGGEEVELNESETYYSIEETGVFWTYRVDNPTNPKIASFCHCGNLQEKDDYLAEHMKVGLLARRGVVDVSSEPWTFEILKGKSAKNIQAQFDLEVRKYPPSSGKFPLDFYLNELQSRDSEKVAKSMQKATDLMVRLTWIIFILTIITTTATVFQAYQASIKN